MSAADAFNGVIGFLAAIMPYTWFVFELAALATFAVMIYDLAIVGVRHGTGPLAWQFIWLGAGLLLFLGAALITLDQGVRPEVKTGVDLYFLGLMAIVVGLSVKHKRQFDPVEPVSSSQQ